MAWHDCAHTATPQRADGTAPGGNNFAKIITNGLQMHFEKVVLDCAYKLDVEEAGGKTYLDNTLVTLVNDQGVKTHTGVDRAVLTLGSAGGYFKTGLFADYRNKTRKVKSFSGSVDFYAGMFINQFWANILYAMGLPRDEWDRYGVPGKGYGFNSISQFLDSGSDAFFVSNSSYVPQIATQAGDKLPIVTA